MRHFLLASVFFYSVSAQAAQVEGLFAKIKGTLVTGVATSSEFELTAGDLGPCKNYQTPLWTAFECPLKNSFATAKDEQAKVTTYDFSSVMVSLETIGEGANKKTRRRYSYIGTYIVPGSAPIIGNVELAMIQLETEPVSFRGSMYLMVGSTSLKAAVQAVQVE